MASRTDPVLCKGSYAVDRSARTCTASYPLYIVNGRSKGGVEEAVRRIKRETRDAQVTGVAADLGTKEGVDTLTRNLPAIDILVNNLGIYEAKPFSEITDEDWLRFFEINVLSGVRLGAHWGAC